LESLKWINLDSNKLTTFDPFIFQGLAKLEKIHLNHNLIDRINPVAFENNNLNGIFLVANRLTFIDPSLFVSLKKLSEFKIDENRFSSKSLADIQKQFPTKVKITHENQTRYLYS
jgi:Leucine-rich repeat (LRR) protein